MHVTRHSAPIRGPWLRPCARPLSTAPAWSFHGRVCCRQAQSPGAAAAAGPGHPAAARNFAQDGRIHGALSGHAGCHWQWRSRGLRAAPGGRGAGLRLGAFGMWLRRQGLAASTVPSAPDSASRLHAPLQAGFSARQSHGGGSEHTHARARTDTPTHAQAGTRTRARTSRGSRRHQQPTRTHAAALMHSESRARTQTHANARTQPAHARTRTPQSRIAQTGNTDPPMRKRAHAYGRARERVCARVWTRPNSSEITNRQTDRQTDKHARTHTLKFESIEIECVRIASLREYHVPCAIGYSLVPCSATGYSPRLPTTHGASVIVRPDRSRRAPGTAACARLRAGARRARMTL